GDGRRARRGRLRRGRHPRRRAGERRRRRAGAAAGRGRGAPRGGRMSAPAAAAHGTAFSFDIEDWFHSEFVPEEERRAAPESVVLAGTLRILDLLRATNSRSTFFLLGDVVREHPVLLRRMV